MPLALKLLIFFVLSLGMFWAVTLYLATQNEARAEANNPPEGQLLDVGGAQVHAVVMGEGPDLVLIHGSSGNTRDMTHSLAPKLAETYRVIVFDRPGLGYTDALSASGATIHQQASLLSEAAQQLGADAPIVLGHSYGGAVAMAWAVDHPDRLSGVIALSAATHPWASGLSTYYKILSHPVIGPIVCTLIAAYVPDSYLNSQVDAAFAPDPAPTGYAAHFGPRLVARRTALRANALQRANLLEEITALVPHYANLSLPVEILHGDADNAVGLKIHSLPLSEAVPGARLTVLKGQGHMTQHTAQDAILAAANRIARR